MVGMSEPTRRLFVDAEPTVPEFVNELVSRQADAEFARREAEARAAVVAKVRAEIDAAFGDDRTSYFAGDYITDDDLQALAAAAVDVFIDLLRNPPTRVTHADGHVEIRWPEEEVPDEH